MENNEPLDSTVQPDVEVQTPFFAPPETPVSPAGGPTEAFAETAAQTLPEEAFDQPAGQAAEPDSAFDAAPVLDVPDQPAAEAPALPYGAAQVPPPYDPAQGPAGAKGPAAKWLLWLLLGLGIGLLCGVLAGFSLARVVGAARALGSAANDARENIVLVLPEPTWVRDDSPLTDDVNIVSGEAIETEPAAVYRQNVNAVVGITSSSASRNVWGQTTPSASLGTGFVITADGYILTNYHVVGGYDMLTVTLYDGSTYPAELVGYESATCDVALLKIDATGLDTVTLGDSDSIIVGEQVCTIGNPLGELTHSLTVGFISATDRVINTDGTPLNMLQTDCVINAGNSGGPLFDMRGNVIGITTAKYFGSSVEGIGFVIPINDVTQILDDLKLYGYAKDRPFLGVKAVTRLARGDNPAGAYVRSVAEGSCAENAGIRSGDLITQIGDYPVDSYEGLVAALGHYRAGDRVEVVVWRDGHGVVYRLKLDEHPPEVAHSESGDLFDPLP